LAAQVHDSDVVMAQVYHGGRQIHSYVSDRSMLVEWFEDDDGQFTFTIKGVVYLADTAAPTGPQGDDPTAFTAFGVGDVDLDRIGAAQRGEVENEEQTPLFADRQHWAIPQPLNLNSHALTIAFPHAHHVDLTGAIQVGDAAATKATDPVEN
jgi:hypothetical protein